jgi:heme exporter protein A
MERLVEPESFAGDDLAVVRGGRPVFAGLSFVVSPGSALRLAGPNGSGKSSLIRVMAGLLRPTRGVIRWGEEAVEQDPEGHAQRLVFLGHSDGLKPTLSAGENAAFQLRMRGFDTRTRTAALERAFEALNITSLIDLPAGWLSSGQRRRTALAAVLASDAELWLLDEPTVGLDTASVAALEAAIAAHLASGGIVIAATHTALDLGTKVVDLDPATFARRAASMAELGVGWGIS